ncbi:MAG: phosphoglycerate dehydrogenase [Planctomycetota bacterium]
MSTADTKPNSASATSFPLHKIKVVLLENVHPLASENLSAEGYDIECVNGSLAGDELVEACRDAHMIGIRSKTQLTRAFFESCERLWGVGCFCIGTNQVDLPAASELGVTVFNAPFSNTRSVAELTISEIIALHRRLHDRSRAMHEGRWVKSAAGAHEVRGRTLGIIGYGRIGSQVSVLAEAMGMRVLYHDVIDTLPLGNAKLIASIEALLGESDVVSLHVPQTDGTAGMIGAREIAQMKPGALLINNARGNVVDVDALAEALTSGRLGGAAVDVFPEEPASNDAEFITPLKGLENVILTPHVAGSTQEAQRNIAAEVSGKLAKFMNVGSTTTSVNVPEVELPRLHEDHHRILHYHRNVPGVLSAINDVIAKAGANVAAQHLQSNPHHSYMIMDVSSGEAGEIARGLRRIEETIRVREVW